MKNVLHRFLFLLFGIGLLGGLPAAQASHLLAGDMTYTSLGNNQYRVKFRLYRDCSGITASGFTLSCRNGGCNAPVTVSAPLVQQGNVVPASPLCASNPATCANPNAAFPLFDFTSYEATVTLPPGQWTLSTSQGSRPDIGNLANATSTDLYAEAFLDNSGTGVSNSSPQFTAQDVPVQYVCVNQLNTFGFSAIEPDGDSVVYSLSPIYSGCAQVNAYANYPGASNGIIVLRTNPACLMQIPALNGGSSYNAGLPFPVVMDTVGSCPVRIGNPIFRFNQRARTITFKPGYYVPNPPPGSGINKYIVAVELTEYRRINGVRRLIGRIRHEGIVIVTDCATNTLPSPVLVSNQTNNSGAQAVNTIDTTQISVYSCSYSRVRLNFTDPDNLRTPSAHQTLTVTAPSDINTSPQFLDSGDIGTFGLSGNGTENPVGTFYLQPSTFMEGRVIRITFRVEDSGCPVKGVQTRVVVIRVLKGNRALINAPNGTALCAAGGSLTLQGQSLRPDSVRRVALNTTVAQSYTYTWTVRGNGLNAAQANTASITVNPTVTSRYFLRISPASGFGSSCDDTTSVLVSVGSVPTPTVTRSGFTLTSSATSGNQWYRDGQLIPGATGRTYTATANGSYTVRVFVTSGSSSCSSAASAPQVVLSSQHSLPGTSLSVAPNPTPDGRVQVQLAGYHEAVELTLLDAVGRVLQRVQVATPAPQGSTHALDLGAQGAGMYLLQVRTANSLESRRIVRE